MVAGRGAVARGGGPGVVPQNHFFLAVLTIILHVANAYSYSVKLFR